MFENGSRRYVNKSHGAPLFGWAPSGIHCVGLGFDPVSDCRIHPVGQRSRCGARRETTCIVYSLRGLADREAWYAPRESKNQRMRTGALSVMMFSSCGSFNSRVTDHWHCDRPKSYVKRSNKHRGQTWQILTGTQ